MPIEIREVIIKTEIRRGRNELESIHSSEMLINMKQDILSQVKTMLIKENKKDQSENRIMSNGNRRFREASDNRIHRQ